MEAHDGDERRHEARGPVGWTTEFGIGSGTAEWGEEVVNDPVGGGSLGRKISKFL